MTLRTKNIYQQWNVWLCVLFALAVVYVVLSFVFYGTVEGPLVPRQHRLALPLLVLFVYIAKEMRWDGRRWEQRTVKRSQGGGKGVGRRTESTVELAIGARSSRVRNESDATHYVHSPTPTQDPSSFADLSAAGAELFERSQAIPHLPIPEFIDDGEYLELLGQSAAKGYAPALAKLGEYAMRRAAWVEAYYWMTLAKRHGMNNLTAVMREIRKSWSLDGFPDEMENVNPLFNREAGSVGRALLHADSGHDAVAAKEFLRTYYPDFLR